MKLVLEVPRVLDGDAAAVLQRLGARAGDTTYLTPGRTLPGCIIRDLDEAQVEEIEHISDHLTIVSWEGPSLRLVR